MALNGKMAALLLTLIAMIANIDMITASPTSQSIIKDKHVDCERQCPYYYFPICATNGDESENRMFVNVCEMQAWNCDSKKKYRRTRHNQCQDYHEYVDDLWLSSLKPSKVPIVLQPKPTKPKQEILNEMVE